MSNRPSKSPYILLPAAIAWRIYRTRSPLIKRTRLTPVLLAFVESGALYASSVLAVMIAYASGSNGQYAALDVVIPLVVRHNPNVPS